MIIHRRNKNLFDILQRITLLFGFDDIISATAKKNIWAEKFCTSHPI
jgi:hypothetical protein